VAGGVVLRIRLRFHNHAPQQLAIRLALHQQAADQLGGNELGGAGKEGLGERVWECWEGLGGYGSRLGMVGVASISKEAYSQTRFKHSEMTPAKGIFYFVSLIFYILTITSIPNAISNKGQEKADQILGMALFAALGTGALVIGKRLNPATKAE